MMSNPEAPQSPGYTVAHVLMMSWPAQGHMNPMMQLAHMLSERGVAVTFVHTQLNHQRILDARNKYSNQNSGIFTEKSGAREYVLVSVDDGLTYEDIKAYGIPKQAKALRESVPKLVQLGRQMRPRVTHVLADMFVLPMIDVAQQLGVPLMGFWTESAASHAIHIYFTQNYPKLKDYFASSDKSDEAGRPIDFIPGCPPLNINDISTFLRVCDPSDFVFSDLIKIFITFTPCYSRILFNTFSSLEPEALDFLTTSTPHKFVPIGPLLPSSFLSHDQLQDGSGMENRGGSLLTEDHSCLQWLDKQKPKSVLYVSFGSIAILSPEQIAEFAAGLEASGYLVLMVVRPDQMYVFPPSFSQRIHNLGMCVAWAPQLQVLAHPAVGGFLTHAGWNSVLESVCKGVPMLCWPCLCDQMLNTKFVIDIWKTGFDFQIDPSTGLVPRCEIELEVKHLMDLETSKLIRENASHFQQLACNAHCGDTQANLDSFIQFISQSKKLL